LKNTKNKLFAIIDVETTGGRADRERITEIAIVLHDGYTVIDKFSTLLNPERSIPHNITKITGITDAMVATAPKFYEVAKQIVEFTENAIFVAHNVRFDYAFVQEEFKRLGFTYSRKQLCTVKLSRKTFPEIKSHALGNLISHWKIKVEDRHRALDDALATAIVFEKILHKNRIDQPTNDWLEDGFKETVLPKSIEQPLVESLPESTGIYYFHDKAGTVIYVGKSLNIRKRVYEHFNDKTNKGDKLSDSISDITYEVTGSELIALLLEDYEIKRLRPRINRAQRRFFFPFAVFTYFDEQGYKRFHASPNKRNARITQVALKEFTKIFEAKAYLKALGKKFNLCENLLDATASERACFSHQLGNCLGACLQKELSETYNIRAEAAQNLMRTAFDEDFLLIDKGRDEDEWAVVLIKDGKYKGFGYVTRETQNVQEYIDAIKKYPETADVQKIIRRQMSTQKNLKIAKLVDS